jgi:CO/xanthine dehydrogenase Mo-binding subunit
MVYVHGLLPAALAIWARAGQGRAPQPETVRWSNEVLTAEGLEPLPLARLAQDAHAHGRVVGAAVHAFNRWQWAEAGFMVGGVSVRVAVDGLAVRHGDGADAATRALATTPNRYRVLDRQTVSFPPTRNNNAQVGYNTAVGTLAELVVDATTGKVALLTHHTILECGEMLVPELVSGQIQGGTATGIGLALHEEMPLYEDGPGNGTWNFNRYHLPRGSDVAVWAQTADILPPLSDSEPPKGMAEVVVIPIMVAIVNGIAHAIDHRFRTLPVTPDRILEVLA